MAAGMVDDNIVLYPRLHDTAHAYDIHIPPLDNVLDKLQDSAAHGIGITRCKSKLYWISSPYTAQSKLDDLRNRQDSIDFDTLYQPGTYHGCVLDGYDEV